MKNKVSSVFLLCFIWLFSPSVMAADACEVVLCMYGKATGNSGDNECRPAERAFFNIVKKNKHGFLPQKTADARSAFLLECKSADPAIVSKIISKFGSLRNG